MELQLMLYWFGFSTSKLAYRFINIFDSASFSSFRTGAKRIAALQKPRPMRNQVTSAAGVGMLQRQGSNTQATYLKRFIR
jgi:hypothetical protein